MNMVLMVGGLMIGLLIFATAYKYYEVRKVAGSWLRTTGRVVSARSVARRVRTVETRRGAEAGGDLNIRNFPEVVYEYSVRGRRFTGNRISIGEDLGDTAIEETLQRYPVGAEVMVYYDPDKPDKAVLEYGAPEGVWRTLIIFIAILIALLIGATVGFERLVDGVRARVARPEQAVPVAALIGLAVFMLLIGLAQRRQVSDARAWPSVEGVIETADVDSFMSQERRLGSSGDSGFVATRWRKLHRPDVVYRYTVNDIDYHGSRIGFGGRVYASFDRFARSRVAPYRPGERVPVYYNPRNAAEAVLEPRAYGEWVAWAMMLVFAGVALALVLV